MPDVTVMLTSRDSGLGRRGTTNAQGTLVVSLLSPGTYLVAASRDRLQDRADSRRPPAGVGQEHAQHRARRRHGRRARRRDRRSDDARRRRQRGRRGDRSRDDRVAAGARARRAPVRAAGARRGAAGARLAPVDPGQRRPERVRRPRVVQQLPARRRRQQRSLPQPARRQPEPRRHRGDLAPPEHLRRRLRPQRRRPGQRRRASRARATSRARVYEYFRTSKLDARNSLLPDDNPEPRLRKHQFGGTVGGPIGRWPSFFFANVEGDRRHRSRHAPGPRPDQLPSAAATSAPRA